MSQRVRPDDIRGRAYGAMLWHDDNCGPRSPATSATPGGSPLCRSGWRRAGDGPWSHAGLVARRQRLAPEALDRLQGLAHVIPRRGVTTYKQGLPIW